MEAQKAKVDGGGGGGWKMKFVSGVSRYEVGVGGDRKTND